MVRDYLEQLKDHADRNDRLIDMIWCAIRYGASPNNYEMFDFQHLSAVQRATYVTYGLSKKMIKTFNNPKYVNFFEDKIAFAECFKDFFGRTWISSENLGLEAFLKFVREKDKFIYKPINNAQGQGIMVFDDLSAPEAVFDAIIAKKEKAILEEWIDQHPVLAHVYSDAINCLRIITVYRNGNINFLAGGVTWGNGKKIANASASGIVSPVDFETGILSKPAADFCGHIYEKHPITGVNLMNIQLPYWKETLWMLEKAAAQIPQVGYVRWDVAITPDKPILIEGNTTPGYRYYQIPAHMENKCGNRRVYENCLK